MYLIWVIEFPTFNSTKHKALANTFLICSVPSYSFSTSDDKDWREFTGAKVRKILERICADAEKNDISAEDFAEKGLNAIAALVVRLTQVATADERSAVVLQLSLRCRISTTYGGTN